MALLYRNLKKKLIMLTSMIISRLATITKLI
ncbi:MAG: hypothetical protein ACI959_001217 [Limisphaerales bacterium]